MADLCHHAQVSDLDCWRLTREDVGVDDRVVVGGSDDDDGKKKEKVVIGQVIKSGYTKCWN